MFRRKEDSLEEGTQGYENDNAESDNLTQESAELEAMNAEAEAEAKDSAPKTNGSAPSNEDKASDTASKSATPASKPAAPAPAAKPAAAPAAAFRPQAQPASLAGNSRPGASGSNAPAASSASDSRSNASAAAATGRASKRILTVGNDIQMKGEITTCDRLVIEGQVDATLKDVHTVELAESGSFKGTAEIEDAEISGIFEGDLLVTGRLIIYATGVVRGNITYGEIEIERGGQISGNISQVSEASDAKSQPKSKAA
ncbi:MAG: hypothetical protein CMM94_06075 [Rickettsiales bacterium]|nr:hypothetical protein [Rickettsiales bacterium]